MAFKTVYQLKIKKSRWIDVLFYFAFSLLAATILCYFIFSFKIFLQNEDIKKLEVAMESVGTDQQKDFEKTVSNYQKKINDFMALLKNREFVSAAFSFMEQQTFFDVWFDKFVMNKKDGELGLSGEADNMAAFSRQIATLEKNEYVKKITVLNSNLGNSGVVKFSLNLTMNPKLFIPAPDSSLQIISPSSENIFNTAP